LQYLGVRGAPCKDQDEVGCEAGTPVSSEEGKWRVGVARSLSDVRLDLLDEFDRVSVERSLPFQGGSTGSVADGPDGGDRAFRAGRGCCVLRGGDAGDLSVKREGGVLLYQNASGL